MALATLAVYWPLRRNDFVNYDDGEYILVNPHLKAGLTMEGLKWAFTTGYASNWHPVTWMSHMVDVEMFGLNPAGHHLVNLGLHIANAILLFLLLAQMTGTLWRSGVVAGLFALHPLHIESVAWAAERKDVLSAFFGLLSLLAYVKYVQGHRSWTWYGGSLVLFALGLMSKPMLVTLPFVMLLLDYWPLHRFTKPFGLQGRVILEKIPFIALSAGSCIATMAVQQGAMGYFRALPFSARFGNAVVSCFRYVAKTFWPVDLAVFYPHPAHWPLVAVVAAGVFVLVVTISVCLLAKKSPFLSVGWFWFLGMLVPVIGIVQVGMQAMADRYMYLPIIGIFVMAVWGAQRALGSGWAPRAAAVGLLIACAVAAHAQLLYWRDSETLFLRAAAVTSGNWVAHHNLGVYDLERYQQLRNGSLEDQRVQSGVARAAGGSESAQEYLRQAIEHCQAALEIRPSYANAHVTLAKALLEQGNASEALPHLEAAVKLAPKNSLARQNLADVYLQSGKIKEAIVEYKSALELEPDWDPVMNNLAWLLATQRGAELRNGPEAVRYAERANALTSGTNLWYLHTLAAAQAENGNYKSAVAAAEKALQFATVSGRTNLIQSARVRLNLYRSGQPLRDP